MIYTCGINIDNLYSFRKYTSSELGFSNGAWGYGIQIGQLGIIIFQYHGTGSQLTVKFPMQFLKEECYVSIVDNATGMTVKAYANISIDWYSSTGYTGITFKGVNPGIIGLAMGIIA